MDNTRHSHEIIDIGKEDPETQKRLMEEWFYDNFEDPAERTPYNSREGGYLWIHGSPCHASEELFDNFSGIVPDNVIEELAEKLDGEMNEWAPIPKESDYDQSLIDDISKITNVFHNFSGSILDIEKLLDTTVEASVMYYLYKLLYVNVITAMETYLSDTFISNVISDKKLMRKFVESLPEFNKQKFVLSDVYKEFETIEDKTKKYLADTVWHNLHKIKPMYKSTLDISFPDMTDIMRAIEIRHHIVHRNGKDKDGKDIMIAKDDVIKLIDNVEDFVRCVDNNLS